MAAQLPEPSIADLTRALDEWEHFKVDLERAPDIGALKRHADQMADLIWSVFVARMHQAGEVERVSPAQPE